MNKQEITSRQQHWLDHVVAAVNYDGTIVEYAKQHKIKTKDIYQWKTALIKKGFLPLIEEPVSIDFVPVQSTGDSSAVPVEAAQPHCRIPLPNGTLLELFTRIDVNDVAPLLSALRSVE